MGFWRSTGKVATQIVDIRADKWFGLKAIKESSLTIFQAISSLFKVKQPVVTESFIEALDRFNIKKEELEPMKKRFFMNLILFLVISLVLFLYAIYEALSGSFTGFLLSSALTFSALAKCFYYHFWLFQLNQERLGLTFKDWFNYHFLGMDL